MSLWVILTAMIAVAAVFAAAPFIRRQERNRLDDDKNVTVFKDQLKEVEAEAAGGGLDAAQAEAARTEIKRRMLARAAATDAGWSPLSSSERTFAAVAVAAIVGLGSVILFVSTADIETSMRFSGTPQASTEAAPPAASAPAPAKTAAAGGGAAASTAAAAAAASNASTSLPPVDELIKRIETRLEKNPKDDQGWRMLGWSYFNEQRYGEAAKAYGNAVELKPDNSEYRDGQIESIVQGAKGTVSPEAKTLVDAALKVNPKDSRALFVKGLALDQGGDHDGAVKVWTDLKASLDPKDPWAKEVAKKLGGAADASADAAPADAAPAAGSDGKGPTQADVQAAQSMSQGDRVAMIQGMVNGLAERLRKAPKDAEGWAKLIKARMVLGEPDKAQSALDDALKAFSDDPDTSKKLMAAAEDAGLKPAAGGAAPGASKEASTGGDASAAPAPDGKGPTEADVQAAQSMSAGDRTAMIQGMVNGLAERLQKSPKDAEGWAKLIKARMVLGEPDKAKTALDDALKAFSDDPDTSKKLVAAAEAAGLKQ